MDLPLRTSYQGKPRSSSFLPFETIKLLSETFFEKISLFRDIHVYWLKWYFLSCISVCFFKKIKINLWILSKKGDVKSILVISKFIVVTFPRRWLILSLRLLILVAWAAVIEEILQDFDFTLINVTIKDCVCILRLI